MTDADFSGEALEGVATAFVGRDGLAPVSFALDMISIRLKRPARACRSPFQQRRRSR